MRFKLFFKGMLLGGVIMLLLGVAIQALPWGFGVVTAFPEEKVLAETIAFQPHTGMFTVDSNMHAFIVVSDAEWHSLPRKLMFDLVNQMIIAGILSGILMMTSSLRNNVRIGIIALMAAAASFGCFVPDWNWWGFSALYVVGASVNLVIVWVLTAYILTRFVFKSNETSDNAG